MHPGFEYGWRPVGLSFLDMSLEVVNRLDYFNPAVVFDDVAVPLSTE